MVFEGQSVLVSFTPYTIYYEIRSELGDLKHSKSWNFFDLVKSFGPNEWNWVVESCNLTLLAICITLSNIDRLTVIRLILLAMVENAFVACQQNIYTF